MASLLSNLSAASAVVDTDILYIVQGAGSTEGKVTRLQLLTGVGAETIVCSSDSTVGLSISAHSVTQSVDLQEWFNNSVLISSVNNTGQFVVTGGTNNGTHTFGSFPNYTINVPMLTVGITGHLGWDGYTVANPNIFYMTPQPVIRVSMNTWEVPPAVSTPPAITFGDADQVAFYAGMDRANAGDSYAGITTMNTNGVRMNTIYFSGNGNTTTTRPGVQVPGNLYGGNQWGAAVNISGGVYSTGGGIDQHITFTTAHEHNFVSGQTVVVTGVTPSGYNGTYIVGNIGSTTTFDAGLRNLADPGTYTSGGSVNNSGTTLLLGSSPNALTPTSNGVTPDSSASVILVGTTFTGTNRVVAQGNFVVRANSGTVGTNEFTLSHDGTNANINVASGNLVITATSTSLSGYENQSNATVAAAGSNQAGATALTTTFNFVTSGTGGVVLPTPVAGRPITVINTLGSGINVYPAGTNIINALGASNAYALGANTTATFRASSTTQWYT